VLEKASFALISLKKLAMNVTESKPGSLVIICPIVWVQECQVGKIAVVMTAIILRILGFLVRIVMNVLVIMAVKKRPSLQSKYNILLACLAGTDLLLGATLQPSYIVGQIYVIKGIFLLEYYRYHMAAHLMF